VRETLQNLQAKSKASAKPAQSELLSLIQGILRGRLRLAGSATTPERSTLWLCSVPESGDTENPRPARVTEAILRGELPKHLAARMAVSRSTISSDVTRTIRRTSSGRGSGSVYRVPMALPLLAQAARGAPVTIRVEGDPWHAASPFCVVSVVRPDGALEARLTPAEYAIVRLILEGRAQGEIADLRRTSRRTIANQSHAIFEKLGVSGRFSLLRLAVEQLLEPTRSLKGLGIGASRRQPVGLGHFYVPSSFF
jgi:DNA-binding NarL/FixJ family response regulator